MDIVVDDAGTLAGSLAGGQDVIQEALMTVRDHLGMEIAYFSEFVDGRSPAATVAASTAIVA